MRGTTLSNLDVRILDHNSAFFGVDLQQLMHNAAQAVAQEARRLRPQNVLIVCGPGNNGGDGMTAATLLTDVAQVRVMCAVAPDQIKQPQARWAYDELRRHNIPIETYRDPQRLRELCRAADLVVDALLGIGASGDLREPVRTIVKTLNASRRPILSIDVPTGLGGRTAVHPAVTVALHAKKQGMTRSNSGRILVRDIGIPERARTEVGPADFFVPYPRNRPGSHKGQNGRVLVVAGGPYTGAPVLCASAALRSGVDLVRLYAPQASTDAAQAQHADLIVHPGTERRRLVLEDVEPIRRLLPKVDVLLLGPGLGNDRRTDEAVQQILTWAAQKKARVVLDADALAVAGRDSDLCRRLRPLATPHHGEFKELTGKALPHEDAAALRTVEAQARRLRSTLLVKGPMDIISDGRRTKSNHIHHPAMTTGGTGDVLAGLCAGFWAKGMEPWRAACAAAFVNGWAGRRVAERQGGHLVATDLVRFLPKVFREWLN
jgi:NAD(P)H-hydrate epimerase